MKLFLTACLAGWFAAPARADAFRVWHSTAGTSVEAQLVAKDSSSVLLERRDGRRISVDVNLLSDETKAMLTGLAPVQIPNEPELADLPVLRDPNWFGLHAVYQTEQFDVLMRRNGSLHLLPKSKGKAVLGPYPIVVRPELHFKTAIGDWAQRKFAELTAAQAPAVQPKEVGFQGVTTDGVEFSFHAAFQGNRLEVWGWSKDPPKLEAPTVFQIRVHVIRTHPLDDDASLEAVTAAVGRSSLRVEGAKGKIELPFDQAITLQKQANLRDPSSFLLLSNAWPERRVSIAPPKPEHGRAFLWNYPGQKLYQGFSVSVHKTKAGDDTRSAAVKLAIE